MFISCCDTDLQTEMTEITMFRVPNMGVIIAIFWRTYALFEHPRKKLYFNPFGKPCTPYSNKNKRKGCAMHVSSFFAEFRFIQLIVWSVNDCTKSQNK